MVNYPTHKNCSNKSSRPNPLTSHIPQSQIQISKETIVPGKQKIHNLLLNHEQLFRATNICRIISSTNSSLHPMASSRDLAKRALVALIKFLAGIYSLTVDVKRESPDEEVRKAYQREKERERESEGEREREREGERASARETERKREGGGVREGFSLGCPLAGTAPRQTASPGQ